MLVFDITDLASFQALQPLADEVLQEKARAPMVVVGHKCDLEYRREEEIKVCNIAQILTK